MSVSNKKNAIISSKEVLILLIIFVVSRFTISLIGIEMDYPAIYRYWQYLDVETLKYNLLKGIWYDHTQPPLFNLFLGLVLKVSGQNAPIIFSILLKIITLLNSFLLLRIIKLNSPHKNIPLLFTIAYMLSPATMLFENELFYTTFISLLLLLSCNFLIQFQQSTNIKSLFGFFFILSLICLTRSMYHLIWIFIPIFFLLLTQIRKKHILKLLFICIFCIGIVSSWYIKNYSIFGKFTSSTWSGMNMARNVFHDNEINDSMEIASIEPFSKISLYQRFLHEKSNKNFRALNDRDLFNEFKNDSFINEKHISYMEVSKQYLQSSKRQIKKNPEAYLKNVLQSAIIFFTPATRYPVNEIQAKKLKYYDLFYSFNLSQLANGKQERRIALALSSIPKLIMYLIVFTVIIRKFIIKKFTSIITLFITYTIGYVFIISSLFEHYENMRFRYEIEPLFLILAASILTNLVIKRKIIPS